MLPDRWNLRVLVRDWLGRPSRAELRAKSSAPAAKSTPSYESNFTLELGPDARPVGVRCGRSK